MTDLKIYIVDDDEDDRSFLKDALTSLITGVIIEEKADGELFLKEIKNIVGQHEDHMLVILYINMPKVNGWEVTAVKSDNFK